MSAKPKPRRGPRPVNVGPAAVVAEASDPAAKRYRVPDKLNHRVLGHWPGEEFEAVLPPDQEARLFRRGQLWTADQQSDNEQTPEG